MPLLRTTSACSTVVYQSSIGWNCLVASTACANFAGTTRLFPLRSSAGFAGIAIPPSPAFRFGAGSEAATPVAIIDPLDKGRQGMRWRQTMGPPGRRVPPIGNARTDAVGSGNLVPAAHKRHSLLKRGAGIGGG